MKKSLLIILFVSLLSNNVYAFDFCVELKKAIEICRSEVQAIDSNFDVYLSHCYVKKSVYDTVDHIYVPVAAKGEDPVHVSTLGNTNLRFKFDKCLKENQFGIEF